MIPPMNIDDLEQLAEVIRDRVPGIEGPAFTDHGYIAGRTMTFWAGDRRAHFYFLNERGAISIVCEAAEVKPKRKVLSAKLRSEDDAVKIADRFLKKKKSFDDLPDIGWVKDSSHDELVPHPPDSAQPNVSVGLVGAVDKKKGTPKTEAPKSETKRTDIVTKIMSRPASVAGIGGVTIYTKKLDAMAVWYRERMGLSLRREGDAYIAPLGEVTLTIMESSAAKLPDGLRMIFSLKVSNFDAYVEQIALRGVEIEALDQSESGKFAYVRDPDGNPIELCSGHA
jgi:catechol 2,3-dioxygenase-like lactoylglutathione lyase family enzyme